MTKDTRLNIRLSPALRKRFLKRCKVLFGPRKGSLVMTRLMERFVKGEIFPFQDQDPKDNQIVDAIMQRTGME